MKKIMKILALMSALMLLFSACGKKKTEESKKTEDTPVKQEQQASENGKKEEEKQPEKEKEKEVKTENKNEKSDTGMFLGMSDSNLLVIFSATEKTDVYFRIDPALNFKDSDIELGAAVNYKYTVSETDEKTITFIEASK